MNRWSKAKEKIKKKADVYSHHPWCHHILFPSVPKIQSCSGSHFISWGSCGLGVFGFVDSPDWNICVLGEYSARWDWKVPYFLKISSCNMIILTETRSSTTFSTTVPSTISTLTTKTSAQTSFSTLTPTTSAEPSILFGSSFLAI